MNHSRTTTLHAIAAALAFLSTTVLAATQTVDGIEWTYTVSSGTASVGGDQYSGITAVPTTTSGAIAIPSTLGGYRVTSIGDDAFSWCTDLTSVTIPNSVTSIGRSAFSSCPSLSSISVGTGNPAYASKSGVLFTKDGKTLVCCPGGKTGGYSIPAGVRTIGESAFDNCINLTSVTIPNGVTHIGDFAFFGCSGLTSMTIPDSVTNIGGSAFYDCNGLYDTSTLQGVCLVDGWVVGWTDSISKTLVLTGIRGIAGGAFYGCTNLTAVTIPDSVTSIGDYAFSSCSGLTSMMIPDSVTSIGQGAFSWCSGLTRISVGTGNPAYASKGGVLFTKDGKTLVCCPSGKTGAYSIPSNVIIVGDYAFSSCSGLTSVTIPDNVTSFGLCAFEHCSGLTSMTIPASVTDIGVGAFDQCWGLTNVTIPDSVRSIGAEAFAFCTGLTSVTISSSVTNIGGMVFYHCTSLKTLYVPASWEGTSMLEDACVPTGCEVLYGVLPEVMLTLAASEQTVTADAANGLSLAVTANVSWTARSSASWLTVETASGSGSGSITYNVEANTGTGSRTGTITVSGGGLTRTFTVTQEGVTGNQKLMFDANGGYCDTGFDFYTMGQSYAYLPRATWTGHDFLGWFTEANGGVQVTESSIVTAAAERTLYAHWSQPPALALAASSRTFTAAAASGQTLAVTANISWTAQSSAAWLTVTTASGSGNGTITYNVAENTVTDSRTGTITVAGGGLTRTFAVTQSGRAAVAVTWRYEVDGGTATVTGADPSEGSLVIPASLDGYPVTGIGQNAFSGCNGLTSVTIPASVTNIWITDRVVLGVCCAFSGCSGLTEIYVEENNPVYASRGGVLFSKDGKTLLFCPEGKTGLYAIPDGVVQIGDAKLYEGHFIYAYGWPGFAACSNLTAVSIPDTVKEIDDRAFFGCTGLTTLTIPDSVERIGIEAFHGCTNLVAVHIHDIAAWCRISFGLPASTPNITTNDYAVSNPLYYANHLYADGNEIRNLVIPGTVTSLGKGAFEKCMGLTSVAIPNSVTNIGYGAFYGCSGLTSVTIGNRVMDIGTSAFENCSGVTEIALPDSVTSLHYRAFRNCSGLMSVAIGNSMTCIEDQVFSGCSETLYDTTSIPGVILVDGWAIGYTDSLPANLDLSRCRGIAWEAFWGCKNLVSVTIGNSMACIGRYAFGECSGLTSATIGNSVTSVGLYAFGWCNALKTLYVPTSWEGTSMLDSAHIPEGCEVVYSVLPEAMLTLAASERTVTANASGGLSLGVTANVSWTARSSVSWLTVTTASGSGSGSITYNVAANTGTSSRTGTITVSGGGLTRTFTVTQQGVTGNQKLMFDANGGYCDTGYDFYTMGQSYAPLPKATWSGHDFLGWFTQANGGVQVTESDIVTAAAERTLYAHWSQPPALTLAASSRTFTADAASGQTLVVTANISWTARSSAAWLTVATASGSGNGTITYSVAENTASDSRTGTITVAGSGLTRTFTVTQSGRPAVAVTWSYQVDGGTATVKGADPSEGSLVIPASLDGYPVTGIGIFAFSGCSGLTSVTIPDSVTDIDSSAFSGCSGLTNVALGNSVTNIGYRAFEDCSGLTRMTIPDSVTSIGVEAFSGCGIRYDTTSLPGVRLVDGWAVGWTDSLPRVLDLTGVRGIAGMAFGGCTGLASVTIPANVAIIGASAFHGCTGLTGVTISEGVSGIGFGAFYGCSGLTGMTIPASVTYIGTEAFSGCKSLTSFSVGTGNPAYSGKNGVLFTKDGKTLVCCPGGKKGAYSIPSGVTGIGLSAFENCSGLTGVTIPGSVTNIGDHAFEQCTGLTSMTIPDSVTKIAEAMFLGCSGLTDVTIPDSVTSILNLAFYGCSGLTNLTIPGSVTFIGDAAFCGCSGLTTLTIPESVEGIGWAVFGDCSSLKTLYVPASWEGTSELEYADVPAGCKVVYGMPMLELAAGSRTFTADAASGQKLAVTADVSWTANSSAAWLTVATPGGSGNGTITYSVAANTATTSRTGTITVAGAGLSRTFTVTQSGAAAKLELGADSRTFPAAAAGGQTLAVTANVSWTATSSVSWLTVNTASGSGNGNIGYAVAANTGTASRTGTITVSGGGLSRTFTVTQSGAAAKLELGATGQSFTAEAAGGQTLAVTANVSWTAQSSASWLTVKTSSGSGNGEVAYDVAANAGTEERMGTITVAGGGLTRIFLVTQGGQTPILELGATSQSFTADAMGGQSLAVTANVAWTAKSSATWLTVSPASGSGNGTITYGVAENTATASRTGTITVAGGGLSRTFTVTQGGAAAKLELGTTSQSFTADAASKRKLAVMANVSWTAQSSASWLTLTTASGSGNGNIVYAVTANTGTGERMGIITVTGGGLTRLFLVTQAGRTETQESPIEVPRQWLEENASGILAANGGDCEAAAKAVAANGLPVWQCYVAGLPTTDAEARFTVKSISFENGQPVVEWDPDLNEGGNPTARSYTVLGKPAPADDWGPLDASSRFFRVRVELP